MKKVIGTVVFVFILEVIVLTSSVQISSNTETESTEEDSKPQFELCAGGYGRKIWNLSSMKFNNDALDKTNEFRERHGAKNLTLNEDMTSRAQAYANKIACGAVLKHSLSTERRQEGENLAYVCQKNGTILTGQTAVSPWYYELCEKPEYNFNEDMQSGKLHFTQVVWQATKEFGIGSAVVYEMGGTCTYIVARYREAGNMVGIFQDNVRKGNFDHDKHC